MSLLVARQLGKRFGGVIALAGFDLAVEEGELVGLIGPNGAGKTTAFNLLTGVLAPSSGQIVFDGRDITRASPETRSRLGLTRTFQNIRLFGELTVRQNVAAGAHAAYGAPLLHVVLGTPRHRAAERTIRATARAALERVGLLKLADQRAGELSYGDQRRIEIARALASQPRILLLDEPAAGMNQAEKVVLAALIRDLHDQGGLTIVLIEHNVRMVANLCPRVVVMHRGEVLAEGITADVLRQPDVAEVYLGRSALAREPASC